MVNYLARLGMVYLAPLSVTVVYALVVTIGSSRLLKAPRLHSGDELLSRDELLG